MKARARPRVSRAGHPRFNAAKRVIVSVVAGTWLATGALVSSCSGDDNTYVVGDAEVMDTADAGGVDTSCLGEDTGSIPPCEYPLPDGAVIVPGSCSGNEYVSIPYNFSHEGGATSPCDILGAQCSPLPDGATGDCFVYALCADGSFSVCSCAQPVDGRRVEGGTRDKDATTHSIIDAADGGRSTDTTFDVANGDSSTDAQNDG
jgi:hypothetical protein